MNEPHRPVDRAEPARTRPDGILVLGKVKAILDAFAEVGQAGASETAIRIGANKSTTFRLLNSMARIGLLDRRPNGTYALGLWLMELGSLAQSRLDVRRIAEQELLGLNRAIGLTVYLTLRHGEQATCIDRIAGEHVDVLALRLGGTLPLYAGAGPRVLLAALSEPELAAFLGRSPFPALTPHTLTSSSKLRADVEMTRERGYVLSMEDVTVGVAAIGVPVFDAAGQVVAAISAAGLRHEFEGDRAEAIAGRLRASAARVSANLGAPVVVAHDPAQDTRPHWRDRSMNSTGYPSGSSK